MKIKLTSYGIAKDIVGERSTLLECTEGVSISKLKDQLSELYPAFAELRHFQIAINESYEPDDYMIQEGDEVVIIPPVSGG